MGFGGGGFFGSGADQSKKAVSTATLGGQTQAGNPTNISLSAGDDIKRANITVNNVQTDYGAISESFGFAEYALGVVADAMTATSQAGQDQLTEVLHFAEQSREDSADKVKNLMPWVLGMIGLSVLGGGIVRGWK